MPFTFGQALLQGVQAGQRNRQEKEELDFRREAQKAVNELNRRQFEESIRQYDTSREDTNQRFDKTFGLQERDLESNISYREGQQSLAKQAQGFLESQYVDLPTQYGNANINVRDLLADQRARESLSFAKSQTRPITFEPGSLEALSQAYNTGDFSGLSDYKYDYRTQELLNNSIGVGIDDLQQAQRGEIRRQVEGQSALRDYAQFASSVKGPDPTKIANPDTNFFQDLFRGFAGESAQEARARKERNASAKPTTEAELSRSIKDQEALIERANQLPFEVRQQAFQYIAPNASKMAADTQYLLDNADLSKQKRKELENSIMKMVAIHLQNIPQQDPQSQALNAAFAEAVDDGDTEAMVEISKVLATLGTVEARQSDVERKAANDRFGNLYGQ